MKRLDRTMVVLYCVVAALPFAAMRLKWHDRPIAGVLPVARYPKLSLASFRSETFQTGYTTWFESKLGFKGTSIAVDNTLLYHAFHDTKTGSQVMLGRDRMLFKDEDIAYFNKSGAELPDQARVEDLANRIASVQNGMREQHRAFVPLIVPSKTTVFPDKVAARWTRDLGTPRPSDERIYRAIKRALDARKVVYVDAREMFLKGDIDRELLWSNDARHWSYYGACLAMVEVVRDYAELTGRSPLAYDCPVERKRVDRQHDDYDMWRLLNLWGVPRAPRLVPVLHRGPVAPAPVAPADDRPSLLLIGTSFEWTILRDAERTQRFGRLHFNSYNKVLVAWPEDVGSDVHPHTEEWRDLFLHKDLYVLELFEVYLFAPGSYVDQTLDELGVELVRGEEVNDPTTGAAITDVRDLGVADGRHHFELWGSFPDPATPYTATITCDGTRHPATVYYQNVNGQQLNVHVKDPGVGACDRTQSPARAIGVSCTFRVKQGASIGAPPFGPRRVCPGPQGSSGQDPDGRCSVGLRGC